MGEWRGLYRGEKGLMVLKKLHLKWVVLGRGGKEKICVWRPMVKPRRWICLGYSNELIEVISMRNCIGCECSYSFILFMLPYQQLIIVSRPSNKNSMCNNRLFGARLRDTRNSH